MINESIVKNLSFELGEYFGTIHAIIEVVQNKNMFSGFLTWYNLLDSKNKFMIEGINPIEVDDLRNILTIKGLHGTIYKTHDFSLFFIYFSDYYEDTFLARKKVFNYFYNYVLTQLTMKTYVLKKVVKLLGYPHFEKNLLTIIFKYYDFRPTPLKNKVADTII